MKRSGIFLVVIVLLLATGVQAADLSVYVTCATQVDDHITVWFGYSSSDDLTGGGFGYIGNGPGIEDANVLAGDHPRAAMNWIKTTDEPIMLFVDGFFGDELLYSEAWFDPADYDAQPCDEEERSQPAATIFDDAGMVNDPRVNDRANTCYEPGQVCISEADWEAGWYLIHKQYGLLN